MSLSSYSAARATRQSHAHRPADPFVGSEGVYKAEEGPDFETMIEDIRRSRFRAFASPSPSLSPRISRQTRNIAIPSPSSSPSPPSPSFPPPTMHITSLLSHSSPLSNQPTHLPPVRKEELLQSVAARLQAYAATKVPPAPARSPLPNSEQHDRSHRIPLQTYSARHRPRIPSLSSDKNDHPVSSSANPYMYANESGVYSHSHSHSNPSNRNLHLEVGEEDARGERSKPFPPTSSWKPGGYLPNGGRASKKSDNEKVDVNPRYSQFPNGINRDSSNFVPSLFSEKKAKNVLNLGDRRDGDVDRQNGWQNLKGAGNGGRSDNVEKIHRVPFAQRQVHVQKQNLRQDSKLPTKNSSINAPVSMLSKITPGTGADATKLASHSQLPGDESDKTTRKETFKAFFPRRVEADEKEEEETSSSSEESIEGSNPISESRRDAYEIALTYVYDPDDSNDPSKVRFFLTPKEGIEHRSPNGSIRYKPVHIDPSPTATSFNTIDDSFTSFSHFGDNKKSWSEKTTSVPSDNTKPYAFKMASIIPPASIPVTTTTTARNSVNFQTEDDIKVKKKLPDLDNTADHIYNAWSEIIPNQINQSGNRLRNIDATSRRKVELPTIVDPLVSTATYNKEREILVSKQNSGIFPNEQKFPLQTKKISQKRRDEKEADESKPSHGIFKESNSGSNDKTTFSGHTSSSTRQTQAIFADRLQESPLNSPTRVQGNYDLPSNKFAQQGKQAPEKSTAYSGPFPKVEPTKSPDPSASKMPSHNQRTEKYHAQKDMPDTTNNKMNGSLLEVNPNRIFITDHPADPHYQLHPYSVIQNPQHPIRPTGFFWREPGEWMTSHQQYHASRFPPNSPIAERIRLTLDMEEVTRIADTEWPITGCPRFEDMKLEYLKMMTKCRIENVFNEIIGRLLFRTGTKELIIVCKDPYLGAGEDGKGQNMVGKLLEDFRAEMRVKAGYDQLDMLDLNKRQEKKQKKKRR